MLLEATDHQWCRTSSITVIHNDATQQTCRLGLAHCSTYNLSNRQHQAHDAGLCCTRRRLRGDRSEKFPRRPHFASYCHTRASMRSIHIQQAFVPEKHLVTIDTRRLQFICSIEGVVHLAYAALLDRCTESASMPKQRALVRSPRFAITINETPPWRNAWQSKELSRLPRKSERWCMLRGVRPNVMHAVPDTTRKVRGSSCSSPKQLLQSGSG